MSEPTPGSMEAALEWLRRAHVASLESELDASEQRNSDMVAELAKTTQRCLAAEARAERYAAALAKYGDHTDECMDHVPGSECICGWTIARCRRERGES